MSTAFEDVLDALNPHPGGQIRRDGWPRDASIGAWLARADGRQIAELVDLLSSRGLLDGAAVLNVAGIEPAPNGSASAAVAYYLNTRITGIESYTAAGDEAFRALNADVGRALREHAGEEIRSAFCAVPVEGGA